MHRKHQLLFVQGGGQGVHDAWDNKLVESLGRELGPEYELRYPRMPVEDDPDYERWKPTLQSELDALGVGTILVGHSLGGTLLLKLLTEHPPLRKLAALVLIAPAFVGEGGWPNDKLAFPSELGALLPKGVPVFFFQGLADETVPPAHVDLYARAVAHARIQRLPGRDHQLNNDLSEVAGVIKSLEEA